MMVMAKKGFDGSSIGDIAKAAKLTTGLVHYHFKDKLEILHELTAILTQENLLGLRAQLAPYAGKPAQALDAIIDFYLGLGAKARPEVMACWIALSGEALRHKSINKVFSGSLAEVQHLIVEQLQEGARRRVFSIAGEPEAVAAALIAAIQGYFVLAGTARALIPKGSAAKTVKQMATGLLR